MAGLGNPAESNSPLRIESNIAVIDLKSQEGKKKARKPAVVQNLRP
jgi:hypothetical protein